MSTVFTETHQEEAGDGIEKGAEMAPQVCVVVKGKRVPCPGAHLLLGTAHSSLTEADEIRLPDERHVEALQMVVSYLADGRMEGVGAHNAADILDCARLLGLSSVKDACEESLVQCISAKDCVKLRQLSSQRHLPRLSRSCDLYMCEEFPAVLAQPAVLELPRIQVHLDVSSQLLEFGTDLLEKVAPKVLETLDSMRRGHRHLEEAVVQLILLPDFRVSEWTEKVRAHMARAPLSPEKHTPDFYAKLRKGFSPARQLILTPKRTERREVRSHGMRVIAMTKLSDTSSVCLVEEGGSLLVIAISLCMISQNGQLPASPTTGLPTFSQSSGCFISQMNLARSGFGVVTTESDILAIGGFNRDGCLDSVECYSSITNSWKAVKRMTTRRGRLATVRVKDSIYAIGGSDGRKELSSVERLDVKLRTWQKLRVCMPTPRSSHGAVELDGMVYAVGGEHYSTPLRTTEAFDPQIGGWKPLPPMNTPRSCLAVAACAGKLYAIGGKTQSTRCLSSVECYDPDRNVWCPVANMQYARRNAAAVTVGEKIMVIGGYGGSAALRSVEIYDPAQDKWTGGVPLCSPRSYTSAVLYNNQVYAFGGFSGSLFLNTAECFDLKTEQWTHFT